MEDNFKTAHFTDASFQAEVLESKTPVLVDFYAEWCGPCKMMSPSIEKLAKEYDGKFKIGKMDIEANEITSGKFQIQSIPTLIFFKDGQEVGKLVGFKSEEALRKEIETYIK